MTPWTIVENTPRVFRAIVCREKIPDNQPGPCNDMLRVRTDVDVVY